jgi:hypothetical protein
MNKGSPFRVPVYTGRTSSPLRIVTQSSANMFALPAWLLFVGSSALSVRANIDYSTFSEIRIWTPVEEGNRFLNLRLQTSISSDLIIYQGVEDSRFQDSGPTETDTHRCIGKVMFKYNSDSPPQVVFNNTEMTVKPGTLGDVAKTAALVSYHRQGERHV